MLRARCRSLCGDRIFEPRAVHSDCVELSLDDYAVVLFLRLVFRLVHIEHYEVFLENFGVARVYVFALLRRNLRRKARLAGGERYHAPLNVGDWNHHSASKARVEIAYVALALPRREYSRCGYRFGRIFFRGKQAFKTRGIDGRKAYAQFLCVVESEAAPVQPVVADFGGFGGIVEEPFGVPLRRVFVDVEKLLAHRRRNAAAARFVFERNSVFFRNEFDGFRKIQIFLNHCELEQVAPLRRAEAVVEAFFGIDEKRRRLFVREGT